MSPVTAPSGNLYSVAGESRCTSPWATPSLKSWNSRVHKGLWHVSVTLAQGSSSDSASAHRVGLVSKSVWGWVSDLGAQAGVHPTAPTMPRPGPLTFGLLGHWVQGETCGDAPPVRPHGCSFPPLIWPRGPQAGHLTPEQQEGHPCRHGQPHCSHRSVCRVIRRSQGGREGGVGGRARGTDLAAHSYFQESRAPGGRDKGQMWPQESQL